MNKTHYMGKFIYFRSMLPGDAAEHIYEDVTEQQMACNRELQAEHHTVRSPPTNPYIL